MMMASRLMLTIALLLYAAVVAQGKKHGFSPSKTPLVSDANVDETSDDDLQSVLELAADGIRDVIENGYPPKNIPAMDPLNIPTVSSTIHLGGRGTVTFTLNDPILIGLATIDIVRVPKIDFGSKTLAIAIRFDSLELSSEDYDREGSFKLLLRHDLTKTDRFIEVKCSDVTAEFAVALGLTEDGPELQVVESQIDIGDMDVNIEDSLIVDQLIPFFENRIEKAVSSTLSNVLENVLTTRLQAAYEAQRPIFNKLTTLYDMKKEQGLLQDQDEPLVLAGFAGVGQLPLPMFWKVPQVPVNELQHVSVPEILKTAKTGDLLLFSGVARGSYKIRRWTQSRYSHVAVIIKEPDLFGGALLCWQSSSSSHNNVLLNMESLPGCQLNTVEDMLNDYKKKWTPRGAIVCYRKLLRKPRDDNVERECWKNLHDFILSTNGIPYTHDMDGLYVMGLMEIDIDNRDTNFFCAGLVAKSLMKYGILKDILWQHQYAPRDFSAPYRALPFVDAEMDYGPEVVVDLE